VVSHRAVLIKLATVCENLDQSGQFVTDRIALLVPLFGTYGALSARRVGPADLSLNFLHNVQTSNFLSTPVAIVANLIHTTRPARRKTTKFWPFGIALKWP